MSLLDTPPAEAKPLKAVAAYDFPYDEHRIVLGDHVVMRNIRGCFKQEIAYWKGRHGVVTWREEGFTWFKQADGIIVISENCDVKRVVDE